MALLTVLHATMLVTLILLYYGWLVDKAGYLMRGLAVAERLKRRFPARHVEAVQQLGTAGVLQACFFVVLILIFRPKLLSPQWFYCDPVLALLGIILGIGEMGFSTLLGFVAIVTITAIERRRSITWGTAERRSSTPSINWGVTARGGWMQYYIKTMTILPWPVGVTLVLLYIFFEEAVFRGVVLGSLVPVGPGIALGLSIVLFTLVQIPNTPGWRTALFPVIGALVVGTVHGSLFLAVPTLAPLALAHASFFFASMWSIRRHDASRLMPHF